MKLILLTVLFLNTIISSVVSAEENKKSEEQYEWYIPQVSDEQLPWNSHDPWNEWGSSISLGLTLNQSTAFEPVDDGAMTGVVLGFNGVALSYQTNDTFASYRIEILANKTLLSDKLSVDLHNPDLRVSLMSPTLFAQWTVPTQKIWSQEQEKTSRGLMAGIDLVNVRGVYEDFIFLQLSIGSYTWNSEQLYNPAIEDDRERGEWLKSEEATIYKNDYDFSTVNNSITIRRLVNGFQSSFRILVGINF